MIEKKKQVLRDNFGKNWLQLELIKEVKDNISVPETINDIKPKLQLVESKPLHYIYKLLCNFVTSFPGEPAVVGRTLRYIVMNDVDNKYLGTIEISSDTYSSSARDNRVDWQDKEHKDRYLQYINKIRAVLPTQPFGYNFTGGKLLALLSVCDEVQKDWQNKYKIPWVWATTIAFRGSPSQYDSLQYYKRIGRTVKDGSVYLVDLFDNSLPFLRQLDSDYGLPIINKSADDMFELWKDKYGVKRYNKMKDKNMLRTEVVFYDNYL